MIFVTFSTFGDQLRDVCMKKKIIYMIIYYIFAFSHSSSPCSPRIRTLHSLTSCRDLVCFPIISVSWVESCVCSLLLNSWSHRGGKFLMNEEF